MFAQRTIILSSLCAVPHSIHVCQRSSLLRKFIRLRNLLNGRHLIFFPPSKSKLEILYFQEKPQIFQPIKFKCVCACVIKTQ